MVYSVLIFMLLVESCPANKRVIIPHYGTTSLPSRSGEKSTHISEFTDPATGLNPFLDLEEGRTGDNGRNIAKEDEKQVLPLPDFDLQVVEGGPNDRGFPRWNEGFGRRGNLDDRQHMAPTFDEILTEGPSGNRRSDQFLIATESNSRISPDLDSNRDLNLSDYNYLRPVEDQSLDADYSTEYNEVEEEESAVVQEDIAQPKKIPVSKNVLISAAITGASVAVISLMSAICWWRQKMKRVSTRENTNVTENNIESIISDKASTNNGVQKKPISV